MIKQKTGYWKTHPLRKAITVLVGFYLILVLFYYCAPKVPAILGVLCIRFLLFYLLIGQFVLGCLYGIWLDCSCHFKIRFFCLVLFILFIIVSICYFSTYVYPDWRRYGHIERDRILLTIDLVYIPILSVIGGYILSRVISYIIRKKQDG